MSTKNGKKNDQLVKLRKRTAPSGNVLLFLDYVQFGERVRESIGLTLKDPRNPMNREKNQLTMAKAETIRLAKEKELLSGYRSRDNQGNKTKFLPYYRTMMEDRKNDLGNYGNWKSCLRYLEVYCSESTTFGDITPRWVQGFKNYLDTVEKDTYKVALKPRNGI